MGVSNTVQQLSVFLENREGRLEEVLDVLAKSNVNIVALSLADTSDYGMLRLIVSDPHKGRAALKEARETKGMPTVIVAKTIKGKGVSFMEDQQGWHGVAPNEEQYHAAMKELEAE